jgi:hypothetical protein
MRINNSSAMTVLANIQERVHVPPFPASLQKLGVLITEAIESITPDTLANVW